MIFRRRVDLDREAAQRQAVEALQRLEAQEPQVSSLTTWLENRSNQNGFGEDFEFTLIPRVKS